ncbi:MAG TPA: hypothetical protein VMH24_00045 [Candidatus Sulfotelmatobacter sp.]|nr:hypothetical protein [Candidatus Sulfotelmatobacter sp.]
MTDRLRAWLDGLDATWIGVAVFVAALVIYVASNPARQNFYDHFVWQADAYLHGRFAITWPFDAGGFRNDYFQDVYPLPGAPGYALLPFPPLPAILLTPFVALGGLGTDAALLVACLGAVNVGLAWRLTSHVSSDRLVALLATLFYGLGTVAWYASMLGSTWFAAHVVASFFLILAITIAIDGDRRGRARAMARRVPFDGRQFVAGLVFGTAALARLTTILGLPFFVAVGSGGSAWRRGISAALGAAVPVAALLAYNLASSGQLFEPGYVYLYHTETVPVPGGLLTQLFPSLQGIGYHPGTWNAEDLHYLPQNLLIMLAWLPTVQPQCGLGGLFSTTCPLVQPDPLGMSLLLTSPAWLLALPALVAGWRDRLVVGATVAVILIAGADLVHFSQGWVQFGYRFSNDFAPFALVLVTLGMARLGPRRWVVALVAASVVINAWGVFWGVALGW